MKILEIPTLNPEDIEVKVKQITAKGALALLYKTARTDMEYLDKVFGIGNWQCSYEEIKGNLYCTIQIWDEDKGQWVAKQDCGIPSREDDEGNEKKGEASDAFKRAGFRVGIGRELYSSPFIWLSVETEKDDRGKFQLKDRFAKFEVSEIGYDKSRKINRLRIVNTKTGATVYEYGTKSGTTRGGAKKESKPETVPKAENGSVSVTDKVPAIQPAQFNAEDAYKGFCKRHGITPTDFTAWRDKAASDPNTGVKQIVFKQMTAEDWKTLLNQLEKLAGEGYFKEVNPDE